LSALQVAAKGGGDLIPVILSLAAVLSCTYPPVDFYRKTLMTLRITRSDLNGRKRVVGWERLEK